MKILICTSFFEKRTNGTALFPNFALKINELYPQHEVRIVTTDVTQSYDKVFKVQFKYPRPLHAFYSLLSNFSYYRALKNIKKEYDFDVVVFNHAASGVWSRWFLPKHIKVFGFIHDDDSLRLKKENHKKKRHYFIHLIKRFLELNAIKNFDLTLCPSEYVRKILIDKFQFNSDKIILLYQSIDVRSIKYQHQKIVISENIKILFVKSAFIRGGLFDLMDAISFLTQYKFELTVVGANAFMFDEISRKVEVIDNLSVELKGYCTPNEVSLLMYENAILCVPARAEVLGLANVEALAHGMSVVSTHVGGIPEVMDNGNNGWLAKPNNPQSLSESLLNCIESSPSILLSKSEAGRIFVEDKFDYRQMNDLFIEICVNYT